MKHGKNHLQGRFTCFFMFIHRDSSSIIMDSHWAIFIDFGRDSSAVTGQCLIDSIVDDFLYHMM